MDGTWSSNDGVFVATFEDGTFTSRFTRTNEILAQGTYTLTGNVREPAMDIGRDAAAALRHLRHHRRPARVTCNQSGGGSFDLNAHRADAAAGASLAL